MTPVSLCMCYDCCCSSISFIYHNYSEPFQMHAPATPFFSYECGFFSSHSLTKVICCKWKLNANRKCFIVYTYLHKFPNWDIGKFFKNLFRWQKINISFSIVAHPSDLRKGETDWPDFPVPDRTILRLHTIVCIQIVYKTCIQKNILEQIYDFERFFLGFFFLAQGNA